MLFLGILLLIINVCTLILNLFAMSPFVIVSIIGIMLSVYLIVSARNRSRYW